MQDPNFFDSYRRSTQKERRAAFDSTSAASLGLTVKTEESTSCAPEVEGSGEVSTPGVIHGSSQVPPDSLELATPISFDSETVTPQTRITMSSTPSRGSHGEPSHDIMNRYPSSQSTARMSHIAGSEDTVTVCNSSTADSSDYVSSLSGLQCSDSAVSRARVAKLNNGVEMATEPSLPQPHTSPSSDKDPDPCNCLKAPMAFGPLVRLGISLRTSREVLDHLHPFSSNCMLYYRITVLEKHILCVLLFQSGSLAPILISSAALCHPRSRVSSQNHLPAPTRTASPLLSIPPYTLIPHPMIHTNTYSHTTFINRRPQAHPLINILI